MAQKFIQKAYPSFGSPQPHTKQYNQHIPTIIGCSGALETHFRYITVFLNAVVKHISGLIPSQSPFDDGYSQRNRALHRHDAVRCLIWLGRSVSGADGEEDFQRYSR
jgi:hypothetical protein